MKLPERNSPCVTLNIRATIYPLGLMVVLLACGAFARFVLFPMFGSGSPPKQALALGIGLFGVFAVWLGAMVVWLQWAGNVACPGCRNPVYGKLPFHPERINNFLFGLIPFLPSAQVECDHCGYDLRQRPEQTSATEGKEGGSP
ncbi:MAG: hypothetical protein RLN72_13290 [Henriciella sp.]